MAALAAAALVTIGVASPASAGTPAASAATRTTTASAAAATPKVSKKNAVKPLCTQPKKGMAQCFALKRIDVTAHKGIQPNATVSGYGPAELASAYALPANGGAGQTVAIVDAFDDPNAEADLATYRAQFGLPACTTANGCFRKVDQRGGTSYPPPNAGWAGEISLDVDMVSAVAPAAHILLVEADDNGNDNLGASVDEAVALGAKYVSNSYGSSYTSAPGSGEDPSEVTDGDPHYNHPGVAVVASTGDDDFGVSYPAASQYVTAVGGTSLGVGPTNNYRFETGWGTFRADASHGKWKPSPPGAFYYGGGGGTSRLFTEPSYQDGVVPSALSDRYGGHGRVVPDVSMDGDPTTGLATGQTQTFPDGSVKYAEARYGGTSLSSPLFAGVMALADQNAGFAHGFANPALYALAGTGAYRDVLPSPTRLAAVRRDFVNGVDSSKGTVLSLRTLDMDSSLRTTVGYDNVTGIGSPFGAGFIAAMATP